MIWEIEYIVEGKTVGKAKSENPPTIGSSVVLDGVKYLVVGTERFAAFPDRIQLTLTTND